MLSLKGLGIVAKNFDEAETGALLGRSTAFKLFNNEDFFLHMFLASLGSAEFVPSLLGVEPDL